jgi:hypothetical protein
MPCFVYRRDVLKARLGGAGPGRAASNASSSSMGQSPAVPAGPWGVSPAQRRAVDLTHIMMQVGGVCGVCVSGRGGACIVRSAGCAVHSWVDGHGILLVLLSTGAAVSQVVVQQQCGQGSSSSSLREGEGEGVAYLPSACYTHSCSSRQC